MTAESRTPTAMALMIANAPTISDVLASKDAYISRLEQDRARLKVALERILDITRHEPLGNLGNALGSIARAALAAMEDGK